MRAKINIKQQLYLMSKKQNQLVRVNGSQENTKQEKKIINELIGRQSTTRRTEHCQSEPNA